MKKLRIYLRLFRVNQWIKNAVVFTAIIFSGKLFDVTVFLATIFAFCMFCLLSSVSYILNDVIDYPYDRKHPQKKFRPVASGEISIQNATFLVFVLTFIVLISALLFSFPFFILALLFILLHFFYSLKLKKYPVLDIFAISFSFMIRAFGGEVATGFHIPIWLVLTIFFVSLFMASIKRHAELETQGKETRESLYRYSTRFLDFLTYTFASSTMIAYSFYTYFAYTDTNQSSFNHLLTRVIPTFEPRKWMMISIPFVVYGIARYAQLLYEKAEGERPEKIITTDIPLIITMILWSLIMVALIYIL